MLPENCFLFSRDEVGELVSSRLYGHGITEDALILGTDGLNRYFSSGQRELPENGRFCGLFVQGQNDILIKTDVAGQEMLYLYRNGNDWAVSNSFLLLAQMAARRGILHIYEPAIACFHLKQGVHIGEQLISHRTMVEEISIVPVTAELKINRAKKHSLWHLVRLPKFSR